MLLAESDIQGCGRSERLAETAAAIAIKKASRVHNLSHWLFSMRWLLVVVA